MLIPGSKQSSFISFFGLIISLITAVSLSCSSGHGDSKAVIAPRDTAAYNRGMEDGRQLLDNSPESTSLHDGLLEIRSRETYIRGHIRPEAADAYIAGFKDYISAHNDTLAEILF